MILLRKPISRKRLREMAKVGFGNLVKAVVDIKQGIMVVDASLHADEEALLLESGSSQADLWGINLYPDLTGKDMIEFDSMINLRPSQGNLTRSVDDPRFREHIRKIVSVLVT
ncbi:MAG TPA: DUF5674 family protein [Patescibacteria group bacterium]|nr:DUF5674 family protein [Patescibacteria group bacterium]